MLKKINLVAIVIHLILEFKMTIRLLSLSGYEEHRTIHQKALHGSEKTRQIEDIIYQYLLPLNPKNPKIEELHALVVMRDFSIRPLPGNSKETDEENTLLLNREQRAYLIGLYVLANPTAKSPVRLLYQFLRGKGGPGGYFFSENQGENMIGRTIARIGFHQLCPYVVKWLGLDIRLHQALDKPSRLQGVRELLVVESLDLNVPLRDPEKKLTLPPIFFAIQRNNLEALQLLLYSGRVDLQRKWEDKTIGEWIQKPETSQRIKAYVEGEQEPFLAAMKKVESLAALTLDLLSLIGEYYIPWISLKKQKPK